MLKEIRSFIESKKSELRSLSDDIWNHPEVAYTEKYAVARVRDFMKSQGYEITTPYCGIETAFRCEYGSDDGPVFAFASVLEITMAIMVQHGILLMLQS